MIIDVFNHFMPKTIFDRLSSLVPGHMALSAFPELPALWDLDARLRLMDQFDDYQQILSLANPPHDDGLLELHLRNYGGPFSTHVFTQMKEKDILRFEGPLGTFYLREDSIKPAVLMAGGTGFAPIKAIIEHAIHHKIKRPLLLYRGARHAADLYLDELPAAWQREHGTTHVPVLSDAIPEDAWTGRRGLVHEAVLADLPDLSGHEVYACGAPAMIDAARRDFIARCGLPEAAFYADAFTPAAP